MQSAPRHSAHWLLPLLLFGGIASQPALAGGGPENVLLVVNSTSQDSLEIGNHYARLRNLPGACVLHLDYRGPRESVSGKVFREKILTPILKTIDARGLSMQIDMIAYSVDFPWKINFQGDFPKEEKFPPQLKPSASLTGATCLWEAIATKSRNFLSMDANRYVSGFSVENLKRCSQLENVESRGFRTRYRWLAGGARSNDPRQGSRYFLATMLGVTTGRGNSVEEVIASLRRSAYADTNPPRGTFYFMKNGDIRSRTRHACYQGIAKQLRAAGAKAVVDEGILPEGRVAVAGLTLGKAYLALEKADLEIEPGAICEHLTSSGGSLSRRASQTPLTDLIRAGASGASGTVVEPYAIQAKFPLPIIQLHYRRGCSLAEAFYQSVSSPYQLLIVGDPLCQPWAKRPAVTIEGWTAGEPVPMVERPDPKSREEPPATLLPLAPQVHASSGQGTPYWELFVDGQLRMRLPSGKGFALTAKQLGPGWHALSCVASNPDAIESQGALRSSVEIPGDEGSLVRLSADNRLHSLQEGVPLRVEAPGADQVRILHFARSVAELAGETGSLTIAGDRLGPGPNRLQAIAEPSGARSPPIWVVVH